ncbi:unnamed protein product [Durusdinium trenchii]
MSHDGLGQRTVLFSDGAKVYPSLCEKMQVKHFACSHRSGQFCHTVKFKRKTLKVHTGTIDGVWSLLKKALPKQIRTTDVTDKTKINQKIWRHARAWQWRWEHAKHDSLATLTAKTLRGM